MVLQTTPNGRTKLIFSPIVSLWGMTLGCFLAGSSMFAILFDIFKFSQGHPIKVKTHTDVVSVLLDHVTLSTMGLVTVISSTLHSHKLINIYNTLKFLDTKLGLRLSQPNNTPLFLFTFGILTLAIGIFISITTSVNHFATYYVYVPHLFLCYFSCANGNHFYHLCSQFCQRYRVLNERITACASNLNGNAIFNSHLLVTFLMFPNFSMSCFKYFDYTFK